MEKLNMKVQSENNTLRERNQQVPLQDLNPIAPLKAHEMDRIMGGTKITSGIPTNAASVGIGMSNAGTF
jgi:hypothetical protein